MNARYETQAMAAIWGERARNQTEREIWLAVMRAQQAHGVSIPQEAIDKYRVEAEMLAQCDPGDPNEIDELDEIAKIEAETKHDLYARMQFFNRLAGHEYIHLGLTSADIVENTQQLQIARSTGVLLDHAEQLLVRLLDAARTGADIPLVARTHGRPAQMTTVGKRTADWTVDVGMAMVSLGNAIDQYAPRGIKGAVGTQQDLADLLSAGGADLDEAIGTAEMLDDEAMVALGLEGELTVSLASVGQCYPRGMDLPIAAAAIQLAAACNTICTNVRLWAVLGHASETRAPEQVGSSAMPHKVNPRYAERVHGLTVVARGYFGMLSELAGGQWFEGDVSTSAARRVALPGLFHTVDSILANTAYVLDRLVLDFEALSGDVYQHREELVTGRLMSAAVAAGMPRDQAHRALRNVSARTISRLATDPDFPLDGAQIEALIDIKSMVRPAAAIAAAMGDTTGADLAERDPQWPGDLL